MVTICLQCGDEGFSNAFVYCVKCLNFALHRYCLDEMPETLDEFVYWVCDHCEAESCGNVTTAKPKANVSHRKGPTSLVEEQGKVVASKGMEGEMGQQRLQHNGRKRKDVNSPLSTGSKEYSGTRARVENDRFHPAESNARRELIKSSDAVDKIPLIDKWNEKQMKGNYSVVNSRKEGAQKSLDVPQQAAVHQEPPSTSVELARPLIEPVWRLIVISLLDQPTDEFIIGVLTIISTFVAGGDFLYRTLMLSMMDWQLICQLKWA
ncbi:OLC1v1016654C1 [Oldenlandia corymbosa var. corymbosa]|uniref:OLC1v1016654C1 n=1 Tax=Oldenlandia corymbosa var. corymbosa TaxID=529605 RepID=A0AAV1E7L8_OLDCO|nr:OLC1v1016654C1 [Oldenlandia corymbosa var. corymbosa]